ncbi:MAG: J domain-containing protein [Saccharofermentanales bacterium]
MTRDPYEVLGIKQTATPDEIKKAYRQLVKKYHPDNYKDNPLEELAKEKMQEINEAYEMVQAGNSGNGNGYQAQSGSAQQDWQQQWQKQWQQQNRQQNTGYGNQNRQQGQGPYYSQSGCCGADACNSLSCLCCADSCCECFGGDICSCC